MNGRQRAPNAKSESIAELVCSNPKFLIREGWLYVFKKRLLSDTWTRHYFHLDNNNVVSWYKSDQLNDPSNKFLGSCLMSAAVFEPIDVPNAPSGVPKFQIKVIANNKNYLWGVDSKLLQTNWLNSFKAIFCDSPSESFDFNSVESRQILGDSVQVDEDIEEEETEGIDYFNLNIQTAAGKEVSVKSLISKTGSLFLLLRHFGCIFCRRAFEKLMVHKQKLEELKIQIIIVGQGTPEQGQWFTKLTNYTGQIYVDPKRKLYQSFLCKRGIGFVFNSKSLSVGRLASKEGFSQLTTFKAMGDNIQLGGIFGLSPSGFIYRFVENYAGELPKYDELLETLSRFSFRASRIQDLAPWVTVTPFEIVRQSTLFILNKAVSQKATRKFVVLTAIGLYIFSDEKESTKKSPKYDKITLKESQVLLLQTDDLRGIERPTGFDYCFKIVSLENTFYFFSNDEIENENLFDLLSFISKTGPRTVLSPQALKIEEDLRRSSYFIRPKELELENTTRVGAGASGTVTKSVWLKTTEVAVKFLKNPELTEELEAFYNEVKVLSTLRHPQILTMYGFSRYQSNLCLVTEFIQQGSLKDFLFEEPITSSQQLNILKGTSHGMHYLHSRNVLHRDLKPANLLVENWELGKIKICDLGISAKISKYEKNIASSEDVALGSPSYAAPELASGNDHSNKVDVFSFAIIAYEVLVSEVWPEVTFAAEITDRYTKGDRPQIPTSLSSQWKEIIENSWAQEPSNRLTFLQIAMKISDIENGIVVAPKSVNSGADTNVNAPLQPQTGAADTNRGPFKASSSWKLASPSAKISKN